MAVAASGTCCHDRLLSIRLPHLVIDILLFHFEVFNYFHFLETEKETCVGEFYRIAETEEIAYMETDLPDEYVGSNYTKHIKGTVAKAKANAASGKMYLYDILEIKKTSKSCQA